ncbi:hypothetical protein ACQ4PT_046930 [Festuca glaucescens]
MDRVSTDVLTRRGLRGRRPVAVVDGQLHRAAEDRRASSPPSYDRHLQRAALPVRQRGIVGGAVTVANPATCETLPLPPLPCAGLFIGRLGWKEWHDADAYSFAYHPATGQFKVVHVPCSYERVYDFHTVHVFTMGRTTWREVSAGTDGAMCKLAAGVVAVHGMSMIYWITITRGASAKIVLFDLTDDRTVSTTTPVPARHDRCHLTEVHGGLGYVLWPDVWVLEDGNRWSHRYNFEQGIPRRHFVYGEYVLTCKGLSFHAHRPNGTPSFGQDMVQIGEHDERTLVAEMVAARERHYDDNYVTFAYHVSMGYKQAAELEWISQEGAVKIVDLKLLRELFNSVNRATAVLVEPSSFVPQTEADSVVREVVIRQAAGNASGFKPAGNVGVEPDDVVVRKSAGAIVRRDATVVGHLAGVNALVKRTDAAGGNVFVQPAAAGTVLVKHPAISSGNVVVKRTDATGGNALVKRTDAASGDPNVGISEDIQAAFPSVSLLKNFSKNRDKNVAKKTFPKSSTPQKTTPTKNTSKETTTKKATRKKMNTKETTPKKTTPKKMNTKETTPKKTTPKKMNTKGTTPKKKSTRRKKQAKTNAKKDDDVDMIHLDSDDDFLDIEAEMEQEEMDIRLYN